MSLMKTILRVDGLERRIAALEVMLSQVLESFPEGYRGEHKGFKRYFVVNRFGVIAHEINGGKHFDSLEAAQAAAEDANRDIAA